MDDIRKLIWGLGIALVVLGAAVAAWTWQQDDTKYSWYQNPKEGFAMQYPGGWVVNEWPQAGVLVAIIAPRESSLDKISRNWNVSATRLVEPLTLEQYRDAADKFMKFTFPKIETKGTTKIWIAGRIGWKLVYRDNSGGGIVFVTAVFIDKNDIAHNITYLTTNDQYNRPQEQNMINKVLLSVKVSY